MSSVTTESASGDAIALHTATFTGYLASCPTLAETSRFLVGLFCWPLGAQGAVITTTATDGSTMVAAYLDQVADWPVHGEHADHVDERLAGRVFHWPLGTSSASRGELTLVLTDAADHDRVADTVRCVIDPLTIYVAGHAAAHAAPPDLTRPHQLDASPDDLTPRQLRIVQLMGDGLTNRQIASRIGFSDSTVRAESLNIYRALDVHDRHEAVVVAASLGLIRSSDTERKGPMAISA